jgi:hypothetical protein
VFSIFTLYVSKILLAVIRLQKHADVLCYRDVEMGRKVWGMGALEVGLKVCVWDGRFRGWPESVCVGWGL